MQRMGRGFGFRLGSVMGMTGASIVGLGLYTGIFLLMCLGGLILGYAVASLQMYRFAAVELAPPAYRARAISWVTAGGVVAGIIGPSLVRITHDQVMPLYLATYGAMVGIHLTVFTIMSFIRFPSMAPPPAVAGAAAVAPPRPLLEIASQPRFIVAVASAMAAFGMMSFLMSASPLAIVACGLPHTEAHWVIFLHVMGMFVPAFFTGQLIARHGVFKMMMTGIALLVAGVAVALTGVTEWHFRIALCLNGVGWNFLFVGATTLLTTTYRPAERGKAQAFNDFMVFGATTTASLMASVVLELKGWAALNYVALGLVFVAFLVIGLFQLRHPSRA
jgi:predicted MFS family arabinose efflux permease